MTRAAALLALALVGCGGATSSSAGGTTPMTVAENTNAPPPEAPPPPAAPTSAPTAAAAPGARTGSGTSQQDPVIACGPIDSYRYVASEFRCPDGSNPLGGDEMAGRGARQGNVGANQTGHIIDLYQIPCPGGPVDVYVDMYGCPEMESSLGGV